MSAMPEEDRRDGSPVIPPRHGAEGPPAAALAQESRRLVVDALDERLDTPDLPEPPRAAKDLPDAEPGST